MMKVVFTSIGLLAFIIAAIITRWMIGVGVADIPDHRSSHRQTTSTSGGVGIVVAILICWIAFYFGGRHHGYDMTATDVLIPVLLIGLLGFLDDKFTLPTLIKFALILGLAAWSVWQIGPVTHIPLGSGVIPLPLLIGFMGSVLWVFVATNGTNFMDGSNGMLCAVLGVASAALIAIYSYFGLLQQMWLPIGLLAGLAALAIYNFRAQALIFAGDVGSLTTGFSYGLACLILVQNTPEQSLLFVGPLLILPFLADILLTMARRVKHGENILTPHRSHIYQRLIQDGQSHVRVAIIYGLLTFVMVFNVVAIIALGVIDNPAYLIGAVLISVTVYSIVNRRIS